MRELHALDAVAYVRFASVYRSFGDVHEFMRELEELIAERRAEPRAARRSAAEPPGGGAERLMPAGRGRPTDAPVHAPRARARGARARPHLAESAGRARCSCAAGAWSARGSTPGPGRRTPRSRRCARRGGRARGAELFVTLEPCTHHGRTPPCVDALLGLGLSRVVVARAPIRIRACAGAGIRRLRAARHPGDRRRRGGGGGRAARRLPLARAARASVDHAQARRHARRPDRRARRRCALDHRRPRRGALAHELRGVSDAVLVGAGTVRADDPRLTCRHRGRTRSGPRRGGGPRARPAAARARAGAGRPADARGGAGRRGAARGSQRSGAAGVEVLLLPGAGGRVPFGTLVRGARARAGFTSVLVEGGGEVAAEALRAGVVDRVVLFVAPALLGGDGVPAVGAARHRRGRRTRRGSLATRVRRVGEDLVVEGRPRWRRRHPLPLDGSRATVGR